VSVGSLANTSVQWHRPTYPPDGGARTLELRGELLARVQPAKGSEAMKYGRELELTPTVVYLAGRVDIEAEDELTLPGGQVLLVRHVQDTNLLGTFTTVTCEGQR